MGANLSINSSTLVNAANKMEDAANRIDAAIRRIDSAVAELKESWNDELAMKYLAKYEDLKKVLPEFQGAAHNYSAFLNAVVNAYLKDFVDPTSTSVG